ncbi:transketolase family protein [Candidatus Nanosynbacter featherlites]|uniref:Transketolase family protein n=1 Tax=Candidatus Nanosynbacter featherlites TaxID=2572088 RepID=A0A4P9A3G2_9BACT|nr:transketolase C-terminal domain-containing protein [Candidatus Nanosynbacter featherlites]QCT42332.1 transketolase family protein [Candidatus Nanosynbacter featherlites]
MMYLRGDWQTPTYASVRGGFGDGLVALAKQDDRVVALSADLVGSVGFGKFAQHIGAPRLIEVGVAEQNLVTVASGLAAMGNIPFAASYASFSPGRNWEQIRTTICLNNQPVKVVGSHAGLNVGPDGATHQMLEDIALMRSLPNMVVLAPGDAHEAELMAAAMVADSRPNYVRLPRADMPLFLGYDNFEIGKAYVLREGKDVALLGTGTMTYQLLLAAEILANQHSIQAEVIHFPTIKPLDEAAVLSAAQKCGCMVTAEEGQIAGGFGSSVAELLSEQLPVKMKRIGANDMFGESGSMVELWQKHGLDVDSVVSNVVDFLQ